MLLFEINPQGARKMIQQNMSLEDGAAERERSFLKGVLWGKGWGGKAQKIPGEITHKRPCMQVVHFVHIAS
jgi:hypothetical protein